MIWQSLERLTPALTMKIFVFLKNLFIWSRYYKTCFQLNKYSKQIKILNDL